VDICDIQCTWVDKKCASGSKSTTITIWSAVSMRCTFQIIAGKRYACGLYLSYKEKGSARSKMAESDGVKIKLRQPSEDESSALLGV
jgi:hypothetical protein